MQILRENKNKSYIFLIIIFCVCVPLQAALEMSFSVPDFDMQELCDSCLLCPSKGRSKMGQKDKLWILW